MGGQHADGRDVRRTVRVQHHEKKTGHLARGVVNAVAQRGGILEQIRKRVLCVIVAVWEALEIDRDQLFEMLFDQRPYRVSRGGSRTDRLTAAGRRRGENTPNCLKDCHFYYTISIQSP